MSYDIIAAKGHYEIFINGDFYCTTDTYLEAEKEVKEYAEQHQ